MLGSLRLGKFFGIDVYVHATFWLLPLFVFLSGSFSGNASGAAFDVLVLFGVFGCIVLHEVGHALAARYYRIGTRDITLYPIGGVARLERMPERPLQEIVVALAGPAVNLVIAGGLLAGLLVGNSVIPQSFSRSGLDLVDVFVIQLLVANIGLLLFNLLPAFPMDGGRVLRAVLGFGMSRVQATRVAVGVGTVVAVGFGLVGLFGIPPLGISGGNLSLILVAVVVYLLGHGELAGVQAADARQWLQRAHADGFEATTRTTQAGSRGDRFTGWMWDPVRRVWGQWQDGVLVREVAVM